MVVLCQGTAISEEDSQPAAEHQPMGLGVTHDKTHVPVNHSRPLSLPGLLKYWCVPAAITAVLFQYKVLVLVCGCVCAGGFNFYWAWVTGRLAGIGAAKAACAQQQQQQWAEDTGAGVNVAQP